MRINNKRVIPIVNIVYTFLMLGILCGLLLILVPIPAIINLVPHEFRPEFPYLIICLFSLLIFSFKKTGPQQFEYSSDGETITIRTKDPFWSKYFPQNVRMVDFPKRKLSGFKIKKKSFGKRLELYIRSKRSKDGINRIYLNIKYLNDKEISDLKRSLYKVIQKNKEAESMKNKEEEYNERSQ
ncbi:MAG: hypothetical protein WBF83_11070 [Moheibacter sp.]